MVIFGYMGFRFWRRVGSIVGSVLALFGAGGCGSSHSAGRLSGVTAGKVGNSTTDGFVASAEKVCGKLNARLQASEPPLGGTPAEIASNAAAHVRYERASLNELQGLKVPANTATQWREILRYRRMLIAELRTVEHAWTVNDQHTIKVLAISKQRLHDEMYRVAHRAGFSACARVGPAT
jgi:hypothetical protein